MAHFYLLEKFIKETIKNIFEAEPSANFDDATKPAGKPQNTAPKVQQPKAFNLQQFDSIQDPTQRAEYADQFLKYLGHGSSRIAFQLDNSKVLKVAHPDNFEAGKTQNEAETQNCEAGKGLFISVYPERAKDFSWIITDLAGKVDPGTFQKLTNINWEVFTNALTVVFHGVEGGSKNVTDQHRHDYETVKNMPAFVNIVNVAKQCNVVPGDLTNIDNFGVVNNKLKLIDFGFRTQHIGKINTNPNVKV